MGKHAERGSDLLGLPGIAAVARLLCWGRHCNWAHSTGFRPM
jgi:hypothetical protein